MGERREVQQVWETSGEIGDNEFCGVCAEAVYPVVFLSATLDSVTETAE